MIQRYVAKISGPPLDRIDIHIEVPAVQYKELRGGAAAEGSAQIRSRVMTARAHDRILKVARTIDADLKGADRLAVPHLAEAIQYRTLDRSYGV